MRGELVAGLWQIQRNVIFPKNDISARLHSLHKNNKFLQGTATRFGEDFKKRLGQRGYQIYVDKILDEMLNLRKLKKELYGK